MRLNKRGCLHRNITKSNHDFWIYSLNLTPKEGHAAANFSCQRAPVAALKVQGVAEDGVRDEYLRPRQPRGQEDLLKTASGFIAVERNAGTPRAQPARSFADEHHSC